FGIIPAGAFFLRHCRDITFNNFKIQYKQTAFPYSFICDNVHNLGFPNTVKSGKGLFHNCSLQETGSPSGRSRILGKGRWQEFSQ
ncbi:MAG TPA: hypothetical protein VKS21_12190, partial [Spirochaetota bacterium]|nr:hypothetical protein [Spirochaetota bacterium]